MKKYLEAEKIQLVDSGAGYFDLLEQIINESTAVLHLQTYIFDSDETGFRIINALKKAAERKVAVYVMIDSMGSTSFSGEAINSLRNSGVNFRFFAPLFSSESIHLGRRLHYKIVVADKKIALTGGINIANKYRGDQTQQPWFDQAVFVKGDVCEYLHLLCGEMFNKKTHRSLRLWEKSVRSRQSVHGKCSVRFRLNDWLKWRNEIHSSYFEAIKKAENSVTIVASYFLPGLKFRRLLADTTARGIKVKIILTGKSDVFSAKLAENYLYDFYIRHKIQIYEWNNSVLHAKAMVVDNKWTTIGSYNLNFLSRYLSVELNTDVLDPEFAERFSGHIDKVTENGCKSIDLSKPENKRNPIYQLCMWLSFNFFRGLMFASVSKKRQEKKNK